MDAAILNFMTRYGCRYRPFAASGQKSKLQMGFEPTTLRDLVGCSNHWLLETAW